MRIFQIIDGAFSELTEHRPVILIVTKERSPALIERIREGFGRMLADMSSPCPVARNSVVSFSGLPDGGDRIIWLEHDNPRLVKAVLKAGDAGNARKLAEDAAPEGMSRADLARDLLAFFGDPEMDAEIEGCMDMDRGRMADELAALSGIGREAIARIFSNGIPAGLPWFRDRAHAVHIPIDRSQRRWRADRIVPLARERMIEAARSQNPS